MAIRSSQARDSPIYGKVNNFSIKSATLDCGRCKYWDIIFINTVGFILNIILLDLAFISETQANVLAMK